MATVLSVNEESLANLVHQLYHAERSGEQFQTISFANMDYLGLFGNDGKIKDPLYKVYVSGCGLYHRVLGDMTDNATEIKQQKTSLFRAINEGRKNADDNAIVTECKKQSKSIDSYKSPIEAISYLFGVPSYRMDTLSEDEIRDKVRCKIFVEKRESISIYNDGEGISDFASTICNIGLSGKSGHPALYGEFSRGFLAMLNHCESVLIISITNQRVYFTLLRPCPYSEASTLYAYISKDKCWWDYLVLEDGRVPSIPLSMFNEKLPDGTQITDGTIVSYFDVKDVPKGATVLFSALNFATPFAGLPAEATDLRYRDRPARLKGAGTMGYSEDSREGDVEEMIEDKGSIEGRTLPVIIKIFDTKREPFTNREKRVDLTWKNGVVFFTRHGHTYYTLDVGQACLLTPKLQYVQDYFNIFVNMDDLDIDFIRPIMKPNRELDEADNKTRLIRESAMRVVENNSELQRIIEEKLKREVGGTDLDQFVEELTEFDEGDLIDDGMGKGKIVREAGQIIHSDGTTTRVERKQHIHTSGNENKEQPQELLPADWFTRLPALHHERKKVVHISVNELEELPLRLKFQTFTGMDLAQRGFKLGLVPVDTNFIIKTQPSFVSKDGRLSTSRFVIVPLGASKIIADKTQIRLKAILTDANEFRETAHVTLIVKKRKERTSTTARRTARARRQSNDQLITTEKELPIHKKSKLPPWKIISTSPLEGEQLFDFDRTKNWVGFDAENTLVMYDNGIVYPVISNKFVQERIKEVAERIAKRFSVPLDLEKARYIYLVDVIRSCWHLGNKLALQSKETFADLSKRECNRILGSLEDKVIGYYTRKLGKVNFGKRRGVLHL